MEPLSIRCLMSSNISCASVCSIDLPLFYTCSIVFIVLKRSNTFCRSVLFSLFLYLLSRLLYTDNKQEQRCFKIQDTDSIHAMACTRGLSLVEQQAAALAH